MEQDIMTPDIWEPGRYFDSSFCKICGCEVAHVYRLRHYDYHREVAELLVVANSGGNLEEANHPGRIGGVTDDPGDGAGKQPAA